MRDFPFDKSHQGSDCCGLERYPRSMMPFAATASVESVDFLIPRPCTDLPFCFVSYYREEFHKGKSPVPETRTEEGSAKRNIARKHDHDPSR